MHPSRLLRHSRENKIRTGMTRLYLIQAGGIWTDVWVCLHYWVVIWVAGYINFHLYCTVYGECHRQNKSWPYGCILFETFYCLPLSSSYKTAHGHWPHVNVCRLSCGGLVNMLLVLSIISHFTLIIYYIILYLLLFSLQYMELYVFNWRISV